MNTEYSLGLTLAVVIMLIGMGSYVHSIRYHFALDHKQFEQVGVMEYKDNGSTVYIPVFKRK